MIYQRFHSKVGPSPGTPQDPQEPFQPLGHLGTLRTPFDPENLPATTSIPRDVMREKYFGNNNKFFIFKPQFFNYKTLSILNRLFLGNNLLEIFNSLLKPIKYNLIHIFKIDFGINSKKSNFFSML